MRFCIFGGIRNLKNFIGKVGEDERWMGGAMKMTRRGVNLVIVGMQKANPKGTTGNIVVEDVIDDDSKEQLSHEEAEDR